MEIKTTAGDTLQIENNEFLKFNFNNESFKVLLKKIHSIGGYQFEDNTKYKKFRTINLILSIVFFLVGVKLIFDPYKAWEGRSYEEVSRIPDIFVWTIFLFSILLFRKFNNIVKQSQLIDLNKGDYELTISVYINDDPQNKKFLDYVICRGSYQELKDVKEKLEAIKNKALLV